MGGQVLGGGVIVLVAVLLWLVYLLPSWHSRYQYDASERNALRLNQALRVLAETSETPGEVRLELNARTALAQQKLAKQQQRLARQSESERESAELEDARLELLAARALPAARRARARRRARLITTAVGLVALVLVGVGAWQAAAVGSQVLVWSGGAVALVSVLMLRQMARVGAPAVVRVADAAPAVQSGVQDVALSPAPAWTPRSLPRPLVSSAGSRASAVLDGADALRAAAREEALRARAAELQPPSIAVARRAHDESAASAYSRLGQVDDAEIEAHVRQLLASRASA